eukprot:11566379-Alexandrium_andersonii.AAC.1
MTPPRNSCLKGPMPPSAGVGTSPAPADGFSAWPGHFGISKSTRGREAAARRPKLQGRGLKLSLQRRQGVLAPLLR